MVINHYVYLQKNINIKYYAIEGERWRQGNISTECKAHFLIYNGLERIWIWRNLRFCEGVLYKLKKDRLNTSAIQGNSSMLIISPTLTLWVTILHGSRMKNQIFRHKIREKCIIKTPIEYEWNIRSVGVLIMLMAFVRIMHS